MASCKGRGKLSRSDGLWEERKAEGEALVFVHGGEKKRGELRFEKWKAYLSAGGKGKRKPDSHHVQKKKERFGEVFRR